MSATARRFFIFLDEWLGIALLLYLRHTHDPSFWWVFWSWAVMLYVVSYPTHWFMSAYEFVRDEDEHDLEKFTEKGKN